jgi:hypothetical protein
MDRIMTSAGRAGEDFGPVVVQVEKDMLQKILALVEELSQDLRYELELRHDIGTAPVSPAVARRYDRDTSGCTRADQLLAFLRKAHPHLFMLPP